LWDWSFAEVLPQTAEVLRKLQIENWGWMMVSGLCEAVDAAAPARGARVGLFGMEIDAARMGDAVARVLAWVEEPAGLCKYVVTPNVDHVVMYQQRGDLRGAYAGAALVLADGAPVIWASRLLGRPLPERVAGSDLCPALFEAASAARPLRVYLLGAAPGVAARAAERIEARWPAVEVVGVDSPPPGFEKDPAASHRILEQIRAARPDVLLVGLGAPKQELWVCEHRDQIAAKAALCIGATIDFLAGERRRAPRWMRKTGLEWLHRAWSEPRRLAGRYARDAWIFPRLVWRQWRVGR
jgi:N-acetylglucosaminyldiphosphoundecaprenol N-acetyl-beta-D-mannosaminyltransferase